MKVGMLLILPDARQPQLGVGTEVAGLNHARRVSRLSVFSQLGHMRRDCHKSLSTRSLAVVFYRNKHSGAAQQDDSSP